MIYTNEEIKMIRKQQEQCDQHKKITENILQLMYDKQLFKLFVPKQLGGKMVDLPTAAKIFQKSSFIDGNFGWLVTIGSGGNMFVPNMTEKAVTSVYKRKDSVIAGSGFPAGTAKRVENGYIVNGQWLYCSGSQYATTFTVTCSVEGSDDILAFALNREQVTVLNDWDAFGLRGTSSHSIHVDEQFVSDDYVFSVFKVVNDAGGEVHTFPFLTFSETSFVAMSLGISEHFLSEVNNLLQKNEQCWPKERHTFLHDTFQHEKNRHKYVTQLFYDTLQSAWDIHVKTGKLSEEKQQQFTIMAKRIAMTVIHSVNELFRLIDMEMVMESSVINQIWRDLHTATQHMFLMPTNAHEATPYDIKEQTI